MEMTTKRDKEFFEKIKCNDVRSIIPVILKDISFEKWIREKTPKLQDGKHKLSTMVYWVLHGIEDFPPCKYAHEGEECELGFGMVYSGDVRNIRDGYVGACCRRCKKLTKERLVRMKNTCMEKYGVDNYLKTEKYKENFKKWLDEHGVENPFQLDWVKKKSNATRKERYGYEYTMQSPEKRQLASENYFRKTGYLNQCVDPNVRKKAADSWKFKTKSELDDIQVRKLATLRKKFYRRMCKCEAVPLFTEDYFASMNKHDVITQELEWKCTKCGNSFESTVNYNNMRRFKTPARCPHCYPFMFVGSSNNETELGDFIESVYHGEIMRSDRSQIQPYELDVFIPEMKIAFEYDGLFWHSSLNRPNDYHLLKTEMCEERGIHLIHVFEDEWIEKNQIVKERIKNLLGLYDRTIYARKCEIKPVDSKYSRRFQEENHLQGSVSSSVSLGLYYDGELVSLMTFGKPRFTRKHKWELLRFCNKLGCHIPGGASKLFSHFENEHRGESIVSYADRRWSNGNVYYKLGFALDHMSKPNYFYTKQQRRFSRVMFQKHKLRALLKDFNPSMTEVENMENNGYEMIFDCGNMVFVKNM